VVAPEQPVPAVPVDQSVGGDAIACLCCGRAFKSLKRHLMAGHKMTPDEYRAAWVLGKDYPMVAPNYAEQRSALALSIGFGRKTEPAASVAEPAPVVEVAPVAPPAIVAPVAAKRGRKPKPNGAGAHA
jgi:predicted transcriptional regulator